ncbi:MAG: ribosomal RNA small subunit methyltransferase A, partial [Anaerolineales bacterium]
LISPLLMDKFFKLIKAGFSQKRKMLRNSLSGGLGISPTEAEKMLAAAGINPMRRAETLSLEEWGLLSQSE